ncbi:hypothetical protein PTQ35_07055 [Campylobacter sp. 46490-21]|uniref:hypothetical protein n=1 Tax=Campylobacter magnus TaxID=3026462 RepID=UPI0023609922|nr:hypothetical protein [Campylobacter magnus]MDD0848555.1 hypothetical protein [Campylobacter magnus]
MENKDINENSTLDGNNITKNKTNIFKRFINYVAGSQQGEAINQKQTFVKQEQNELKQEEKSAETIKNNTIEIPSTTIADWHRVRAKARLEYEKREREKREKEEKEKKEWLERQRKNDPILILEDNTYSYTHYYKRKDNFNTYLLTIKNLVIFNFNNMMKIKSEEKSRSQKFFEYMYNNDLSIWMDLEGNICYRTHSCNKVFSTTTQKLELLLSNILQMSVKIDPQGKNEEIANLKLYTSDLPLVVGEFFAPDKKEDFIQDVRQDRKNMFYINTFIPNSRFFYNSRKFESDLRNSYISYSCLSCIAQYLFYISSYDIRKFYYIMEWIKTLYLGVSRDKTFFLIGSKQSGKEFFYTHIIKEIFGDSYCLEIDDDFLKSKDIASKLHNKICYVFKNISLKSIENIKTRTLLKKLLCLDKYVDTNGISCNMSRTIKLILAENEYLMDLMQEDNYAVFYTPANIEEIKTFNPKSNDGIMVNFDRRIVSNLLREDIINFSLFLGSYEVNNSVAIFVLPHKDEGKKNTLLLTQNRIESFAKAIINGDFSYFHPIKGLKQELYIELEKDFNDKKWIKQKNLIKCFDALYPDTIISNNPKGLMAKLRKYDEEFFHKSNIKNGSGGIKYFLFGTNNTTN